jgi:diacylglycerol kinase family enzyme
LFQGKSRIKYLRYLSGVLAGTHPYFHNVVYLQAKLVEMTSSIPIRVQMDGETAVCSPMTFEVVPDALTLLVRSQEFSGRLTC